MVSLSMEVLILNIMAVFVMIGFAIIVIDGFPQDMRVGAVVQVKHRVLDVVIHQYIVEIWIKLKKNNTERNKGAAAVR